jgi:hypothetical protein
MEFYPGTRYYIAITVPYTLSSLLSLSSVQTPIASCIRKLQCQNPKIVSKFRESINKQLAHPTIPERIDALMAVPIGSWTKGTHQQRTKLIQHSATRNNSLRGSATRVRDESLTGQLNCLTQVRSIITGNYNSQNLNIAKYP